MGSNGGRTLEALEREGPAGEARGARLAREELSRLGVDGAERATLAQAEQRARKQAESRSGGPEKHALQQAAEALRELGEGRDPGLFRVVNCPSQVRRPALPTPLAPFPALLALWSLAQPSDPCLCLSSVTAGSLLAHPGISGCKPLLPRLYPNLLKFGPPPSSAISPLRSSLLLEDTRSISHAHPIASSHSPCAGTDLHQLLLRLRA